MECNYLRSNSSPYHFFKLVSLVDARPVGYQAKLQLYVVGEKNVYIALSENETIKEMEYFIGIIFICFTMRMKATYFDVNLNYSTW